MAIFNSKGSIAAAVIAGIGASVCCVGHLALLMLGIGGAWVGNLLAFEPYRPVFIGITFGFLALDYYKLYVAPESVCLVKRARILPF